MAKSGRRIPQGQNPQASCTFKVTTALNEIGIAHVGKSKSIDELPTKDFDLVRDGLRFGGGGMSRVAGQGRQTRPSRVRGPCQGGGNARGTDGSFPPGEKRDGGSHPQTFERREHPMSSNPYDILFETVRIGPVTAPNRFYQVPHCNGFGHRMPHGMAAMRGMKAEGGWGVVCTEETEIHHSSDLSPYFEGRIWDDE
jgi:hypothetical protein